MAPPLVLFCLDREAGSGPAFAAADCFAVNILGTHQVPVSVRFADPGAQRFVEDRVLTWETGAPILAHALAALDCRIHARYDGGDHVILVRSEEHTSELQSLMRNSYAVFCLKNK